MYGVCSITGLILDIECRIKHRDERASIASSCLSATERSHLMLSQKTLYPYLLFFQNYLGVWGNLEN